MELRTFVEIVAVAILVVLALATVLLVQAYRRLRKIQLPPDADFFTTVRAVPLGLVVGLDLLDLGLDIFSTPIIWLILNRLKLQSLRNVASFEALIPFTGPIPTLTFAWIGARLFKLGRPYDPSLIETERVAGRYEPRPRTR